MMILTEYDNPFDISIASSRSRVICSRSAEDLPGSSRDFGPAGMSLNPKDAKGRWGPRLLKLWIRFR